MVWQAWLTLLVVAAMLAALVSDRLPPVGAVLGALLLLLVAGVLTPEQALAGFANPAPITVAALYVLARGVQRSGVLQPLLANLQGSARPGSRGSLLRLVLPAGAASAFLNNTPIVGMLVPQVSAWAERHGVSPSRYLMPLSFAVILGGVVTTIGTSTNLVVSGLLVADGHAPLGLFEITPVGLPVAVAGVLLLVALAPRLLPERRPPRRDLGDEARGFVVSMLVAPGGPLEGRSVEAAGLRHLQGVFLVEVEREDEQIAPVSPQLVLRGGDRLHFVGRADLVVDLQHVRGLVSTEREHLAGLAAPGLTFFEAVLGEGSPLVGRTLREVGFRGHYQAAVVAIHRAGERVRAKLGGLTLCVGDTLLLLADPDFRERWSERRDFLLVARLGGDPPIPTRQAAIVLAVVLFIVAVGGSGLLPILHVALIGAGVLVALGVLTAAEARDAVDLDVVLLVAGSLGLGAAIEHSGLAAELAGLLLGAFEGAGRTGVLLGVVVATMLLTEMVTNNAAAAVVYPIAVQAAAVLGVDPRPFAIAVAVAASASFLTPIGYQTNTMVYGPGGYRFGDYLRLGAPLTVLMAAVLVATS